MTFHYTYAAARKKNEPNPGLLQHLIMPLVAEDTCSTPFKAPPKHIQYQRDVKQKDVDATRKDQGLSATFLLCWFFFSSTLISRSCINGYKKVRKSCANDQGLILLLQLIFKF